MQAVLLLLLFGSLCDVKSETALSLEKSLVFGAGINPNQGQLPLSVIYIQARDENGNKFSVV